MKKQLFTIPLLLIFISSCVSPLPLSKLSPEESEGRWVAGRKYITKSEGDQSLTVSFYKSDGNMLLFDALFENLGSSDIEFSPMYARIIALDENGDTISEHAPMDPEAKLLEFDKSESRAKAQLANQSISNAVISATDLVATVADETNSNVSREQADANFNQREWERNNRLTDMERQESYLESIKNTRIYWEEAPVRRTTVAPNEYINGRIFFMRTEKASSYKLVFDVPEGGKFEFKYRQEIISPYNE